MKGITVLLVAVVMLADIVAFTSPASLRADDSVAPIFVTKIPPGYRDWKLISVSHEAGNLNSIGAILDNDVAIKAYRQGSFHTRTARSSPLCTTVTSRRRKTTNLWPSPIVRPWLPHERSVYGEGLDEVRRDGRLGVRYLHRRQTRPRGVNEKLLPLPQSGQG
jgi:hypothetical protein